MECKRITAGGERFIDCTLIDELVEALEGVLNEFDGLFLKEARQHQTLNKAEQVLKRAKE